MSNEPDVEDETISNKSDVEDEKTKAQFTPRHGSRDPKTTTQGVSDTDKDIKKEVEKIRDTSS
jgi:hypothetical protein